MDSIHFHFRAQMYLPWEKPKDVNIHVYVKNLDLIDHLINFQALKSNTKGVLGWLSH